jgi:uncharacterized protein YabN with tetrapyrrole methylase and pyrophosphatase domain
MQDKVSRHGFLPSSSKEALKAIEKEWQNLQKTIGKKNKKAEEHLGELLFRLSYLAQMEKLNAETALSWTNREFEKQFNDWEKRNDPKTNGLTKKAKRK